MKITDTFGRKGSKNSLASNILRALTANFWVAVIGFVGSFIFPRILTINAYAQYHSFLLYAGYLGCLHLGFSSGLVLKYAGVPRDRVDEKQYKTELLIVLSTVLLFSVLFGIINLYVRSAMLMYVMCAAIPIVVTNTYKALFQSWNQFRNYSRISMLLSAAVPLLAISYYLITKELTGSEYIFIYLIIYWIATIWLLISDFRSLVPVKHNRFFSRENLETEKTGIAILAGNYINVLLHSADKQFVRIFFADAEFAYYSFGMSMQNLMSVFILSLSQPLLPAMAQGRFSDQEYNGFKNLLMIFGSLSGCAYFAVEFVVRLFLTKYVDSLNVVKIYFIVFPVLAVVNCLYVNLYKIKGMIKTYSLTLAAVFAISIGLNAACIFLLHGYASVAIATVITYVLWFAISTYQFKFMKFTGKDVVFLLVYVVLYVFTTNTMSSIAGAFLYLLLISILVWVVYKDDVVALLKKVKR